MKPHKHTQNIFIIAGLTFALLLIWNNATADDLNPPPYRGDPLSVHVHWGIDPAGVFTLLQFSWVDDNDPSTYLFPMQPFYVSNPSSGYYDFRIPNFVDQEPIKYLRLQLTWHGTTQPPLSVTSSAWEAGNWLTGVVTFASNPVVFSQPVGGYQYFDIQYQPNPDFENFQIHLPIGATLTQVVFDSVSTVPEPATLGLLVMGGGAVLVRRKR